MTGWGARCLAACGEVVAQPGELAGLVVEPASLVAKPAILVLQAPRDAGELLLLVLGEGEQHRRELLVIDTRGLAVAAELDQLRDGLCDLLGDQPVLAR